MPPQPHPQTSPARPPALTSHLLLLPLIVAVSFASAALSNLAGAASPWEGKCPELVVNPTGTATREDAVPVKIKPGMVLLMQDVLILQHLIPNEIWRYREIFFHEGMRLEIGPCNRPYPAAQFYRDATARFTDQPTIDRKGNLKNYTAGMPFPPETISLDDKKAGAKWAFNMQHRYRGAGFRGKFRISDLPNRLGGVLVYEGELYYLQVHHRADLPANEYQLGDHPMVFAAGGRFNEPFDARDLAWRQFRPLRATKRYGEPDDIFAYIPTMRKSRRAAQNWVDGLYLPRYTVTGDSGGGHMPLGSSGSFSPTAGRSIAASEDMRRGLNGITLRANAYHWRIIGEKDVLAPINVINPGYPVEKERAFGVSGLSLADDRWDVRHVIVLEGAIKVPNLDVWSIIIYLDYETAQPLYWITRTKRHKMLDVGVLGYRYSNDRNPVPEWPGGITANVFEPVVATFYDAGAGAGGWRRESYDLHSTPFPPEEIFELTTSGKLLRGH